METPENTLLGKASRQGERWAAIIGEEKFKRIYHEQKDFFNQFPSEDEISKQLESIFGADYSFPVNRRGDVYFVNMIDEDTHECVQFMIRDKKIYTLQEEDDNDSEPSVIEDIFRNETDSVIKMIYGE